MSLVRDMSVTCSRVFSDPRRQHDEERVAEREPRQPPPGGAPRAALHRIQGQLQHRTTTIVPLCKIQYRLL